MYKAGEWNEEDEVEDSTKASDEQSQGGGEGGVDKRRRRFKLQRSILSKMKDMGVKDTSKIPQSVRASRIDKVNRSKGKKKKATGDLP